VGSFTFHARRFYRFGESKKGGKQCV